MKRFLAVLGFLGMFPGFALAQNFPETAPESRCSPYDRRDYPYSQQLEMRLQERLGGFYAAWEGKFFPSQLDTQIEHIVSLSEAHDSGLCAARAVTRRTFANDILNIALASPKVNGCGTYGKCGKDAGQWLPEHNFCFFAERTRQVKLKYGLTMDPRETQILKNILGACPHTELQFPEEIEWREIQSCDPQCLRLREKFGITETQTQQRLDSLWKARPFDRSQSQRKTP